ncbi:hypothetical protein [Gracilimonas sediminicola]|uniref:hypothetical protein n=1 Tax=Gracilimonas sediminicola TaxID=2952158 RepID=UPI0038D51189
MNIFRPGKVKGVVPIWKDSSFNGAGISIVDAPDLMRAGSRYYDPVADLFYILGYYDGSAYQDVLYSYNPKNGVWALLSDQVTSSRGSRGYNMFKRGDWLYWGLGFESSSEDSIHRYNLVTDVFESKYLTGIQAGRNTTMAIDASNNTIYCFGERLGGQTRESYCSKIVDIGGPGEQVDNSLADFPGTETPVDGAAVFHKGFCYVKAGSTGSNTEPNTFFKRYNVNTDTWEALAGTPVSTRGGFMWTYNDQIYYKHRVGSSGAYTYFIHRYDINKNEWSLFQKNVMPVLTSASLYAPRKNQLWAFGGFDVDNTMVNKVQVLNLASPSGKQASSEINALTSAKRYPGTLYRNFIVRITQSSQSGPVSQVFVQKTALSNGGIQVTKDAQVDIRQVQFRFRRKLTFQQPQGMNVRAFWEYDGQLGQEKNYAFLEGCGEGQGLDINEGFNTGYKTNIIDMDQVDVIEGGYEYSFDVAGENCDLPSTGFIHFFVSIPRFQVLDVSTGGSISAITEL